MNLQSQACELPRVREVDVAVTGGTVAAVAAALAAAEKGARTLLAAPRLYLGEEVCATLRLWRAGPPNPEHPLEREIFDATGRTTPLQVKRVLAERLVDAGVEVLLGCFPTGLLEDAAGRPAGLVLADRAGRQAVRANALIDGGRHALLSCLAETRGLSVPKAGEGVVLRRACRWVIGGVEEAEIAPAETIASAASEADTSWAAHRYELTLEGSPDSPASMMEAEQVARDRTFRRGQQRASETLFFPDSADLPTEGSLAFPRVTTEPEGRRAGAAAAGIARAFRAKSPLRVRTGAVRNPAASGTVRERRNGLRPFDAGLPGVSCPPQAIPELARAGVVVVGGGTAGAAAAIAAAEDGGSVLVLEFQEALGGVGTVGLIGKPYHGLDIGFAAETPFTGDGVGLEDKAEWLRRRLRKAGARLWFGALVYGVRMEGDRVRGVLVATPYGHGMVSAEVVIDATGNADVAAAAGVACRFGDDHGDVAVQGAGLALRPLGRDMVNSDFLLVDESDPTDVTAAVLGATLGVAPAAAFDISGFVQTRERQRVEAEARMTLFDQLLQRNYVDTVVMSRSDYDAHGYPTDPFFALLPHTEKTRRANHPAPSGTVFTPYRCLLPRGREGLLVAGIGIGMDRDAAAMVRMQRDLLNQGRAVGWAAMLALRENCPLRNIPVRTLQRRLVEDGALPEAILDRERDDSMIPTEKDLRRALDHYLDESREYENRCRALARLFLAPEITRSCLQAEFTTLLKDTANKDSSCGKDFRSARQIRVAQFLGILGDPAGADILACALDAAKFDARIFQGKMAEYAHLPTPVDTLILALGFGGAPVALDPILRKLALLAPDVTLSHSRAVALALERLGDSRAAAPLAAKLREPGMAGHALEKVEPLVNQPMAKRRREGALREIVLARALFRCGDWEGTGRQILETYRRDVRALLARHAVEVLAAAL